MTRRTRIQSGVALTLLIVGAGVAYWYFGEHKKNPEETYLIAPDFSLPTVSGGTLSLSEVPGEVRVVVFWASWDPYSKDTLKAFAELKKNVGSKLTIVALNRDTNPYEGRLFMNSLNLSSDEILFVFDQEDGYFKKIQGFAVPEALFIDRDGNIRRHLHGPMTYEDMQREVQAILE
jgi:thiol-disulfide isomerase/thioredoxin